VTDLAVPLADPLGPPVIGLLVALGSGLLIGLERERRKGRGDDRRAAGVRSFTVAALCGAAAQSLAQPALVAAGALLVALLSAIAYFRSRSRDPGLTTELALFGTYLVGVQCVVSPPLGAACGAGLAALLAARERLHNFANVLLSEQELHDALLLAALGLVVLPLIPSEPVAWLGGINPRPLAALVLLILLLQAAGHVALRVLGPRGGVAASGFFSGFVSSTATVGALGSRARNEPSRAALLACGAVLSTAATWVQMMLMAGALSVQAAQTLAPMVLVGLATAVVAGGVLWLADRSAPTPGDATGQARRALRLREALAVALLLSVVTVVVSTAQRFFGDAGMLAGAALAGLADAHSPIASISALFAAGAISEHSLLLGVLAAVGTNSAMRIGIAFIVGGRAFGLRVGAALLLQLAAAVAMAVVLTG